MQPLSGISIVNRTGPLIEAWNRKHERNAALQLNADYRFDHFISKLVEHEELFVLTDEHGVMMLTTEDEDCIPVWPHPEYAKAWGYPMPEALAIGELWMAKKLYPQKFADIDMQKQADAWYQRFYRTDFKPAADAARAGK